MKFQGLAPIVPLHNFPIYTDLQQIFYEGCKLVNFISFYLKILVINWTKT